MGRAHRCITTSHRSSPLCAGAVLSPSVLPYHPLTHVRLVHSPFLNPCCSHPLLLLLPLPPTTGHNLSQVVLGSLLDQGLNWTLEEPLGRAAFPLLCLGPFLAKLSPSEGERVAQGLAARLGDPEGLPGLGGEEVEGGEGEEARQQLEAFLGHLQVGVWAGF